MCKKKRCYANLEAPLKRRDLLLPWGQPCLRRRDIRDQRDLKDIGDKRDIADAGVVLDEIRMRKLWVDKGSKVHKGFERELWRGL